VPAGSRYVPQAGQTEVVVGGTDSRGVAATASGSTPINQPDTVLVPPGSRYVPTPGETMLTAPTSQAGSGSVTGAASESSSLSATDDAAIAVGAALLIAAAGFAAAQAGRRPPRPA